MSNSIAPGSSTDVNVKVTALTTNPNVPAQYKTIILKKNLVNGVNTLTQAMMNQTNTKYVIKYDYSLGGSTDSVLIDSSNSVDVTIGSITNTYYYKAITIQANKSVHLKNGCVLLDIANNETIGKEIQVTQETTLYIGSLSTGTFNYDVNPIITVPNGCILEFDGGSLSNGTISGTNTCIIDTDKSIFTNIFVIGSWRIPYIRSAWFSDCTNDDVVRQLINLSDTNQNTIEISNGTYPANLTFLHESVLLPKSNTKLILNGTLLIKTDMTHYYGICTEEGVKNVEILGSGTINGGRDTHASTGSEHGHCIFLYNNNSIKISGLHLTKAWGDGIVVVADNVVIENVKIDYCRRQGISLANADTVTIRSCNISNISGTLPERCIDIEPNEGEIAKNISIEDCVFTNEKVILIAYGDEISNVYIKNNTINSTGIAIRETGNNHNNIIICGNVINNNIGANKYAIQNENNAINIFDNIINGELKIAVAKTILKGNVITASSSAWSGSQNHIISCACFDNIFNNGRFNVEDGAIFKGNTFNINADTFGMRLAECIIENNLFDIDNSNGAYSYTYLINQVYKGFLMIGNLIKAKESLSRIVESVYNAATGTTIMRNNIKINVTTDHTTASIPQGYNYIISHPQINGGWTEESIARSTEDIGDYKMHPDGKPIFWTSQKWVYADGTDVQ